MADFPSKTKPKRVAGWAIITIGSVMAFKAISAFIPADFDPLIMFLLAVGLLAIGTNLAR